MLSTTGRGFARALFGPAARLLARLGVSPDVVTVAGTVLTCLAALTLIPLDMLVIGPLVITVCVLLDNLDGQLARLTGQESVWGAFLDSTMDRVADGALLAAVIIWALRHLEGTWQLLTVAAALAALVFGSVVPYAKARAESVGLRGDGGLAERADRLVVILVALFLVGLGLPPVVLTVALWVLALAALITVFQRMGRAYRSARQAID
ncbi:phosphatidylinositol phosphate synthase [Bogoriella caseilytica]|uniref:Phosphatidylinositol phosphate synthase n=1 Tax=Bogoriella caseilytica TaxID=56055 RepID=A0A3N2BGG2_9MICO|nr:CDP-alcohol phosphatidyltransferase family protein [Bogoriella caseilytica]ROR74315.1 CDP-diacylglycerol--glycerol-3-phosphate 3-phosphatidyltransferase [Bogoriella caseilytica]